MAYFAIAKRNGRWEYICSGRDPLEVYRIAAEIIQQPHHDYDEYAPSISPESERLLDTLRVVPEEVAREYYQVQYSQIPTE